MGTTVATAAGDVSPWLRREDQRLLTGRGNFIADLALPRMLEAAFVRSPLAHALVTHVDLSRALEHPDCETAVDGIMLSEHCKPLVSPSAPGILKETRWDALATDRVRFDGQTVAVVLAADRYLAEDMADLVDVVYEPLTPVLNATDALAATAPILHPDLDTNLLAERRFNGGDVDAAFAAADYVHAGTYVTARHTHVPMECRGIVAEFNSATRELTVWSATQIPHLTRIIVADALGLPEHSVRVIAPDVGGGFGAKGTVRPEDIAICAMAMLVGRPVRWIEDRTEAFRASGQAWQQTHSIEVAVASDGTVLAVRDEIVADVGAYSDVISTAAIEPFMAGGLLTGPYRIENYEAHVSGVATNKCPTIPYRGVGRVPMVFAVERAMDEIAAALNISPVTIRQKNMIRDDEFPFRSATRVVHDRTSYQACLARAHEVVQKYASAQTGQPHLLRGVGYASYAELTGVGSGASVAPGAKYVRTGSDSAVVTLSPDLSATVSLGFPSQGQGHETVFSELVAQELHLAPDQVHISGGDTRSTPFGVGTMASRGAVVGSGALTRACIAINAKLTAIAAHLLEIDPADLDIEPGRVVVRGSKDNFVSTEQLVHVAYFDVRKLPDGVTPGMTEIGYYDPKFGTFANATHAAVVDVDIETGKVVVRDYVVIEDVGRLLHPLLADGQTRGAVIQGLSGALQERIVYDDAGMNTTTDLLTYPLFSARDLPRLHIEHVESKSEVSLTGVKGVGEGGTIAAPAAVANAVADALRHLATETVTSFPLTPEVVLALVHGTSLASRQ